MADPITLGTAFVLGAGAFAAEEMAASRQQKAMNQQLQQQQAFTERAIAGMPKPEAVTPPTPAPSTAPQTQAAAPTAAPPARSALGGGLPTSFLSGVAGARLPGQSSPSTSGAQNRKTLLGS